MVNIILISHGEFCEGLLKSLIMVTGDDYGIKTLALYPGMTADTYREKLDQIILENYVYHIYCLLFLHYLLFIILHILKFLYSIQ